MNEVLRDYKKFKDLKRKLKMSLNHENKKHKSVKNTKDAFTRFSVTAFSSVIDALTPDQRKVIENYGFGSLLEFNKCYIPNKFAKWVANVVDYKSGDIVVNGKIISLTKESVHYVLGLPLGGRPFPSGTNSVNSFLCPNSSLIPSQKHFGIFDDIQNAKEFDWSGYVLDWLLEHIKSSNKPKASKGKDCGTLGGCLYYLAVSDSLPRISVWKGNMIKTYSDLDLISPGCYGFRPLLDLSDTCYSKIFHLLDSSTPSLALDVEFMDNLDPISRCKLPVGLKNSICMVIENHSFNCGLRVSLDVSAISNLPENIFSTFIYKVNGTCF